MVRQDKLPAEVELAAALTRAARLMRDIAVFLNHQTAAFLVSADSEEPILRPHLRTIAAAAGHLRRLTSALGGFIGRHGESAFHRETKPGEDTEHWDSGFPDRNFDAPD